MPVFQLPQSPQFPPVYLADKTGLLAVGGALTTEWLLLAYRQGIFPWFNEGEPIMWWSPDPRMVLFPQKLKISRSMRNVLNRDQFVVKFDHRFRDVMQACADTRRAGEFGTWITREMVDAYCELHEMGIAHSVEVYNQSGELAGGLYGLAIGSCFFGESMFSRESNASKTGFIKLVQWLQKQNYSLIDCQVSSDHLKSLGAEESDRVTFIAQIEKDLQKKGVEGKWSSYSP